MIPDLDALTALANEATPGPWSCYGNGGFEVFVEPTGDQEGPYITYKVNRHSDATYIAAVSPDVVLALIARVRAAEQAVLNLAAAGTFPEFDGYVVLHTDDMDTEPGPAYEQLKEARRGSDLPFHVVGVKVLPDQEADR